MRKILLHLSLLGVLSLSASFSAAKDLGTHGHTFAILERNLLQDILLRLKGMQDEGAFEERQNTFARQAASAVANPKPVAGMKVAKDERVFYYDPSIHLAYNLKDHQGRIFHPAGTRINPLDYHSLPAPLVFFNGADAAQRTWVQRTFVKPHKPCKLIMTEGRPFEMMEAWAVPVFFDQHGRLVGKLGIRAVPAVVDQAGKNLRIREIALNKEGKKP